MNADLQDFKFLNLSDRIIEKFYKVYNALGYGFLEKVYENALMYEFKKINMEATAQKPIQVFYEDAILGEYFSDILVDDKIILEIKAVRKLTDEHEAQLLNYLKATNIEVGLLLNFGPKPEVRRKAFNNDKKNCVHLRKSASYLN